ncbi:hypothetical protein PINS_up017451, partial [Pythium insidiosum]
PSMATAAADGDVAVMLQLLSRSLAADADADKQLDALHRQPLSAAFPSRASSHVSADVRLLAVPLAQTVPQALVEAACATGATPSVPTCASACSVAALQEPTPTAGAAPGAERRDRRAQRLPVGVDARASSSRPCCCRWQTQDAQPHAQQRSVELAYRVVKELSTRRLLQHRKQFAALSVELLPLVLPALELHRLLRHHSPQPHCSRTLLLHAFRELVAGPCSQHVHSAFVQFYEQLERLLTLRSALLAVDADATDETAVALLDRVSYRIARVVVETQKAYAIEFRALLTPFLELFWRVLAAP